jgi:hypothetical protein
MPVDKFGFYTLLEPYISGYYEIDKTDKARKVYIDVSRKYQENLTYWSGLIIENQTRYLDEIVTDIERYRSLVDILVIYNDKDFAMKETEKFNNYLKRFKHFTNEDEEEAKPPVREERDFPKDTIDKILGIQD